nr:uncharacterized protein LOC111515688 [Leptinotarsa decemlineata]
MRHTFLFVFVVFAVGRVTGRASFPVQDEIQNKDNTYVVEEVIVEEAVPIVKNIEDQDENDNLESEKGPENRTARVLYNGNQLWKTFVDDLEKVAVLTKLRDEAGMN